MSEKRGCLTLFLGTALVLSLFCNLIIFVLAIMAASAGASSGELPQVKFDERIIEPAVSSDKKIAVIPLRGVISTFEQGSSGEPMVSEIKSALRQAVEDEKVKAIVLNIDSPGGEVTASDIIYNAVKNARAKKPVVIYMNAVAASGGYYIACGGSHLIASPTTWTGSIGVIIQTLNYRELFGKVGLESVVFKSGKFKDLLNGGREMTEEEKAYVQGLVMQTYDRFVGIVATERKLDEKGLRDGIADGRILSGTDAFAAKLVDEIGYVEDAFARARLLGDASGAAVVEYRPSFSLGALLQAFGQAPAKQRIEISINGANTPSLQPGRWYYLPNFLVP